MVIQKIIRHVNASIRRRATARLVPMNPDVYRALQTRREVQRNPVEERVFPSAAKCGHLEQGSAKAQHSAAVATVNAEAIGHGCSLPMNAFEPYVMRHAALTRMSPFCDPFTLAKIAGHSSITVTQRYRHPQADAVEAAFSEFRFRGGIVATNNNFRPLRNTKEGIRVAAD